MDDREAAMLPTTVKLDDDLTLRVGRSRVTLTVMQGLQFSEELARKSFRRALTEEADGSRALLDAVQPASGDVQGAA
jgi:hypothetical protein